MAKTPQGADGEERVLKVAAAAAASGELTSIAEVNKILKKMGLKEIKLKRERGQNENI